MKAMLGRDGDDSSEMETKTATHEYKRVALYLHFRAIEIQGNEDNYRKPEDPIDDFSIGAENSSEGEI
jgi:hypothetical protein